MRKNFYIASIILLLFSFFILNDKKIDLGGTWKIRTIIFNSKDIYKNTSDLKFIADLNKAFNTVKIDDWNKSISFKNQKGLTIFAIYKLIYNANNTPFLILSSKEKSLNGVFNIKIDTIRNTYTKKGVVTINLQLKSRSTSLNLTKEVSPIQFENYLKKGRP